MSRPSHHLQRHITADGDLSDDPRRDLARIADRSRVHRTPERPSRITTTLAPRA